MPRTTRRPLDERARARLREAQRLESDAVTEVLAAAINREGTQSKLDAVIAKYQVAISEADNALNKAHKHLVCVQHRARRASTRRTWSSIRSPSIVTTGRAPKVFGVVSLRFRSGAAGANEGEVVGAFRTRHRTRLGFHRSASRN